MNKEFVNCITFYIFFSTLNVVTDWIRIDTAPNDSRVSQSSSSQVSLVLIVVVGIRIVVAGSDAGCNIVKSDVCQVIVTLGMRCDTNPSTGAVGILVQEVTVAPSIDGRDAIIE